MILIKDTTKAYKKKKQINFNKISLKGISIFTLLILISRMPDFGKFRVNLISRILAKTPKSDRENFFL